MNTITPEEIFQQNQVLTLETAKSLIGKKIAITNAEYRMNRPDVRIFILKDIQSEYELAKTEPFQMDGFNTRQDWMDTKDPKMIFDFKNRLKLVGDGDKPYATCLLTNGLFSEPTFHGSDADREIYYIVIDEN